VSFHNGVEQTARNSLLKDFANGIINPKFIFVDPCVMATDGLFEYCIRKRRDEFSLLIVDEAQCISQWGMTFRPFYQRIPDFINGVFEEEKQCFVMALTQSLNPKEIEDIGDMLGIDKSGIVREELPVRDDIELHIERLEREYEKEERFWNIVDKHKEEKVLVYVYREEKKTVIKSLFEKALERGYKAAYWDEDVDANKHKELVEKYHNGDVNLIFTKNVFGTGIDVQGINVVIHYMIPESLNQYYREISRIDQTIIGQSVMQKEIASKQNAIESKQNAIESKQNAIESKHMQLKAERMSSSQAYLLYTPLNIDVKKREFIDEEFPCEQMVVGFYNTIGRRKGIKIFPYKENDDIQSCLPYYVEAGISRVVGKGFSDLKDISDIDDPLIQKMYDGSNTKTFGRILKDNEWSVKEIENIVYGGFVDSHYTMNKPLKNWLVIDVVENEITNARLKVVLVSISDKKKYKHEQLDEFIHLITKSGVNTTDLYQKAIAHLSEKKKTNDN
jgi:ATP-dependent DNA helicase RecQ